MKSNKSLVDYLKKVTVTMETGPSPDMTNSNEAGQSFQFVYGIGTQGICLFEKALFGKERGQDILLEVTLDQADDIFGHLKPSLREILPRLFPYYIKATVIAVEKADPHEIVHAMAKGSADCSCDCGCGC